MNLDFLYSYFTFLYDKYIQFLPVFFFLGFCISLYFFITDFKDCVPLQGLFSYFFMHIFIFFLSSLFFPFCFLFFLFEFLADSYDNLNERSKYWFNFEKF